MDGVSAGVEDVGEPSSEQAAGRKADRPRDSDVAVRRGDGTGPGVRAGTSQVGVVMRGSPAPLASASSSCSGTRFSPVEKEAVSTRVLIRQIYTFC